MANAAGTSQTPLKEAFPSVGYHCLALSTALESGRSQAVLKVASDDDYCRVCSTSSRESSTQLLAPPVWKVSVCLCLGLSDLHRATEGHEYELG